MNKSLLRDNRNAFNYCLLGACFGFLFPVVATLILMYERDISLLEAQSQTGWLILIIDTAPFFLGIFALFAGLRQDRLEHLKILLQKEIHQKEDDIKKLIASSRNEIFLFHFYNYKFIEVSASAKENLGYSIEELKEMTPWDIKPEYPKDKFLKVVDILKSGDKKKITFLTPHQRKDGTTYPAEIHLQISDFSGQPIFMAMILDQTEKQQLHKEVLRSSKMASIGELAAGVGHEINNPLTVAIGNLEIIKHHLDAPSEALAKAIDKSSLALERIQSIVSGLRTFARQTESIEVFDLGESIDQTIGLIDEIYKREGINLNWKKPNLESPVHGNPGRLQQAIINLIQNAKDSVKNCETKNIDISLEANDDIFEIKVRDSGEGIPEDIQERIFDAFFTTKNVGEGTGIGLALTVSIVNENGGSIDFDSNSDGTYFYIRLPRANE